MKNKEKLVQATISKDLDSDLQDLVKRSDGRSRAYFMRKALEEYINKEKMKIRHRLPTKN